WTTTSGRTLVIAWYTWSRSATSRSAWVAATTSSPCAAQWACRSRPSWPPAPVTRTFTAPSQPGPLLERAPPPLVVAVPLDRRQERLVEGVLLAPAEGGHLVDVHRVAAVVAGAVGHVVDALLPHPEDLEQLVDEDAVGRLVAGPDVVDLAGLALLEHEADRRAVVLDVEPVA